MLIIWTLNFFKSYWFTFTGAFFVSMKLYKLPYYIIRNKLKEKKGTFKPAASSSQNLASSVDSSPRSWKLQCATPQWKCSRWRRWRSTVESSPPLIAIKTRSSSCSSLKRRRCCSILFSSEWYDMLQRYIDYGCNWNMWNGYLFLESILHSPGFE